MIIGGDGKWSKNSLVYTNILIDGKEFWNGSRTGERFVFRYGIDSEVLSGNTQSVIRKGYKCLFLHLQILRIHWTDWIVTNRK